MPIEFLLGRAAVGRAKPKELEAALHALRAMARGGMYDVVGGGFARYSTDNFWRLPHFEKMLYDNALLARAYLHAWQLTGDPFFRRIVEETLAFVRRELTHPAGGFYSSLDADSEGEEGRFYVWTLEEIRSLLGQEAEFLSAAYRISTSGNWEGRTVLQRALDDSTLAARFAMPPGRVSARLAASHEILLAARARRPRPATDDKVITAWNGLMLAAFAEAARVLDDPQYLDTATRNADFLLASLRGPDGLHRSWRDGRATPEVFLEDYASLVLGLLELYQASFDPLWYSAASGLAEEMIRRFHEAQGGFYDTPSSAAGLLLRPRDSQDNATPSGGALACEALLKLTAFSGDGRHRDLAEASLQAVTGQALQYPAAFARWLSAAEFASGNVKQIALIGDFADPARREMLDLLRRSYRPLTVIAAARTTPPPGSPSLLDGRPPVEGRPTVYVCKGFVCRLPVTDAGELARLLEQG